MQDKKHDNYFDDESAQTTEQSELLKKIESGAYDKEIKSRVAEDNAAGNKSSGVGALREALAARLPVQGKVIGVSKSGLTVKILGQRAFCPVSQIDVKFTSDVNEYLSKTLDFVVTKITEGGKNIVVSRVPLFEAGLEEQFKKFADVAGTDKTFVGKISKIVEFGLFVEVGGLEGLVHISEVSWERAQNLHDSFTVGQEVEFVVLKVERKESLRNSKISLSIKQALEDPWKRVPNQIKVGDAVEGKVTRLADFGAFVEVLPGVEGLAHVSEMAWGRRVHHPSEIVKQGQTVKVTILGIDLNKRSVALTLKDVANDPWNGIEEKLAVGADVTGTVARKAKFGYFIDLFEGVTGLMVPSRIAADKRDSLKPGDTVTVQVESIDTEARRVSLSMGMDGVAAPTSKEGSHNDAKEYLKKQNAKQDKSSGTEFGAALKAALGTSSPLVKSEPVKVDVKAKDVSADVKVAASSSSTKATVSGDDKTSSSKIADDVSSKNVSVATTSSSAKTDDVAAKVSSTTSTTATTSTKETVAAESSKKETAATVSAKSETTTKATKS